MRWLLCAGVWVVANLAGLYVAAETKWGPEVLRLSPKHGVHLGDILAVLLGVAVAALVSGVVWATSPTRPATPLLMRWLLCAAVWQVSLVVSLFLAAMTDWGPVVMTLWQDKPVHLGDLLVVLAGLTVASVVTDVIWASHRPRVVDAARRAAHGGGGQRPDAPRGPLLRTA